MFITEIKQNLFGKTKEYQCVLLERRRSAVTLVYTLPSSINMKHLVLPKGTISIGHFWQARHYNCYHFINDPGETLAAYFNVCLPPQIAEQHIYWQDLVIDVLKVPGEAPLVLDEEELPEDLDSSLAQTIFTARDQLLRNLNDLLLELEQYARAQSPAIKAASQDS